MIQLILIRHNTCTHRSEDVGWSESVRDKPPITDSPRY